MMRPRRAGGGKRGPASDVLKRPLGAGHSVIVQRNHVSGPSRSVMQGKVRVLDPTVAVHDGGTLSLDHPAQRGHRPRIGDRRVERTRDVGVKGRQAAAPSPDADDAYAIEYLLGRIVTSLERRDSDRMAAADQFSGEGLHMAFETAYDGPIEISQLENVH